MFEKDLEAYARRLTHSDPRTSRNAAWDRATSMLAERLVARRGTHYESSYGKTELDLSDVAWIAKDAGLDGLAPHEKTALVAQAEERAQSALLKWASRGEQQRREREQKLSMAERGAEYARLTQNPADIEIARQLMEQARLAIHPQQAQAQNPGGVPPANPPVPIV